MRFLIALTALFTLPAFANIVKVTSVYQDLSNKKRELKVSGSGLIVKEGVRQFVFTASHVSQGKNTEIFLEGVPLKIKTRLRHGNNDLELIEVEGADPARILADYNGGALTYDISVPSRRRWLDKYNFTILQDWINDPHLEADNKFGRSRESVLAMDIFSALLNADAIVQPGTSGAPLITTVPANWSGPTLPYDVREGFKGAPAGKSYVRGIAIRRDRFYAHASFVPLVRMRELLDGFLAGKPAPKTVTEWRATGPVLFRKGEVYQETVAYSSATAGGTVTDIGNAITMEGGDLATLGEDTPDEFLSKVSAFPVGENSDPVMFWMLAMRHPRTSHLINFWSWFDMELFPLFTGGGGMFASFVRESPTLNLANQLAPRFGKRGNFEVKYLKVDEAGVHFNLPIEDDRLSFSLTRAGQYAKNARFHPVIEVPSQKGQMYLVDLREFFFVDTANSKTLPLRQPAAENFSREDLLGAVYDEMQAEVGRPRLSYRPKRAVYDVPLTTEQGQRKTIHWF